MSVAPGVVFNASSQMTTTQGPGQAPNFISGGVGLMNNGSLALDTNVPGANPIFNDGIAINATGTFFATTTPLATDVAAGGVRVSALGQLVIEVAVPTVFSSGNGVTANGRLAVV